MARPKSSLRSAKVEIEFHFDLIGGGLDMGHIVAPSLRHLHFYTRLYRHIAILFEIVKVFFPSFPLRNPTGALVNIGRNLCLWPVQ